MYPSHHVDIQNQWVTVCQSYPGWRPVNVNHISSVFRQDGPQLTIEHFSFYKVKYLSFLFSLLVRSTVEPLCWPVAMVTSPSNRQWFMGRRSEQSTWFTNRRLNADYFCYICDRQPKTFSSFRIRNQFHQLFICEIFFSN